MSAKEKAKAARIYKTYGLTMEMYEILLEQAGGGCEICGVKPPARLCIDHIHIKGFKKMVPEEKRKYVRGILCFMCNTGIKCVEKTVDGKRNRKQLMGMIKYFSNHKLKGEI